MVSELEIKYGNTSIVIHRKRFKYMSKDVESDVQLNNHRKTLN